MLLVHIIEVFAADLAESLLREVAAGWSKQVAKVHYRAAGSNPCDKSIQSLDGVRAAMHI